MAKYGDAIEVQEKVRFLIFRGFKDASKLGKG